MNQKIGALFALLAGVAIPSAADAADAIEINGRQLTPQEATLLMQTLGAQIPAGRYWYDTRSGLWGRWGDGYAGRIQPGLPLPPMPPDCSAGQTGVFINGRQITQREYLQLAQVVGTLAPGRYFIDANGDAGIEGGPAQINLLRAANGGGQGGRQATTFYSQGLSTTNGYYDPNTGESMVTVRDSSGKTIDWSN